MSEAKTIPERSGVSVVHKGEQDDKLDIELSYNKELEDVGGGVYFYPTTVLDESVDLSSSECISMYSYSWSWIKKQRSDHGYIGVSDMELSKRNLWEDVINVLEENCVTKRKIPRAERDTYPYVDREGVVYSLPVTGHKAIKKGDSRLARKPKEFFNWNGKRYKMDSERVYTVSHKGRISFLGTYKYAAIKGSERLYGVLNAQGDDGKCNYERAFVKQAAHHWYPMNCFYRGEQVRQKTKKGSKTGSKNQIYHDASNSLYKRYLEIDFGEDTEVTHISTMGRPIRTVPFPKDLELRKKHGYIRARECNLPTEWVTKYTVWAKVKGGKVWENLGRFTGNNDVFTEVCHELSEPIHVQKMRFVPISYCNAQSFRIGIFGPVKTKVEEQEPTVEYLVTHPSKSRYQVKNGRTAGWKDSWGCDKHIQREKLKKKEKERINKLRNSDVLRYDVSHDDEEME